MKILVCVKQVPDTSGKVAVNEDGTLNRASMPVITNPDDKIAVEAALKLKDAYGCKVILVTMGPMAAESMLRELLAMGADEAYLLSDRAFGGSDTFATSQVIAAALHHIGMGQAVSVISGGQAIDGDTAEVGPQMAEKLDLPQITYAGAMTYENGTVRVQRMLEDGYMTIEADTPCLVTCIKELNEPRYMTISGIYDCFSKPITVLTYDDLKDEPLIDVAPLGQHGARTHKAKAFTPPPTGAGGMLPGTDDTAVVSDLVSRLTEKHVL